MRVLSRVRVCVYVCVGLNYVGLCMCGFCIFCVCMCGFFKHVVLCMCGFERVSVCVVCVL